MSEIIKTRSRRARIWQLSNEEFAQLVAESQTISEIQRRLSLTTKGAGYKYVKARILEDGLSTVHFKQPKPPSTQVMTKEEALVKMFVKDSTFHNTTVKKYLLRYKLIPYQCICGLSTVWNNLPLVLEIDHKNGDTQDQRLDNLRWLCGNCHGQTQTFSGKNIKLKFFKITRYCSSCNAPISRKTKTFKCRDCSQKRLHKINWPTRTELFHLVWTTPAIKLGTQLGVSDVAVATYCKRHNIPRPNRAYWRLKLKPLPPELQVEPICHPSI